MKRGLKVKVVLDGVLHLVLVEESSPMKRGLKGTSTSTSTYEGEG
jgi:hypothetical protein